MKTTGALFVGVLKSRTALDRIVDRYDLKKVYGEKLELKAREKLADRTEISEERKSGIIKVTVTDRDPKRAAAIAGSYVDELDTLMAQLTTSSAHRERVFLEQRLAGVTQDLETAEKEFSQFASKNATLDITEQGKAMVMAAATLEGQLIAAQSELEGLRQIYTDGNVRVRSVEARITELRKQLQKIGGKAGAAPSGDSESTSDLPYPSLRQLPVLGVPFADKFRQLKVQEVVFETLTKQYEIAKVQEAKEIPTVKVLDRPEVPERKSFPPRLLLTVLGTCVAFLAGCAWLFARQHWDSMDPEDPGKQFAIDVATTVRTEAARLAPVGGMLRSMGGKPETKNGSETDEEEAIREKANVKRVEPASSEPGLSRATGKGLG
jgi:capsule polysaccharide export protein KpsE/RkpR